MLRHFYGRVHVSWPKPGTIGEGEALSDSLLREISDAKEVRIIEHTCSWDYLPPYDKNYSEKIYARVVLNASQKEQLIAALPPSADYSGMQFMQCIFEPHHRIEIVCDNGSVFKVELCLCAANLASTVTEKEFSPRDGRPVWNRLSRPCPYGRRPLGKSW